MSRGLIYGVVVVDCDLRSMLNLLMDLFMGSSMLKVENISRRIEAGGFQPEMDYVIT